MIIGIVNASLEAIIYLEFYQNISFTFTLPFVVDTGFSEYLSLPIDVITALALPFKRFGDVVLADNSVTVKGIYEVTVIWDGQHKVVEAYEMDRPNLVGMKLMRDYKLTIEAKDGGKVLIESNP